MNKFNSDHFKNVYALVIGDVMLDVFWHGKSRRLSPEAPVPVVLLDSHERILGGAANVVANLKSLGVNVDICSMIGNDSTGDVFLELLKKNSIETDFISRCSDFKTITKTRVISDGQHIVRCDVELPSHKNEWLNSIEPIIKQLSKKNYDFIIISDYDKGIIKKPTIEYIKKHFPSTKIFVDPRPSNKNLYSDSFCITPNLSEARAMYPGISDVNELAVKIKNDLHIDNVIITLSEKGLLLVDDQNKLSQVDAYKLQVKERLHRLDVSGAGDTLISTMAACYSTGMNIYNSVVIGNIAAAIVVNKLGTAVCTIDELNHELFEFKWRTK